MNSFNSLGDQTAQGSPKESVKRSDSTKFYSILTVTTLVIILGYFFGMPHYYLGWISFLVAAFSVAGNDAIQTVGTFIESKKNVHWLPKVLLLCGLLFIVHYYVWAKDSGEIYFGRLNPQYKPDGSMKNPGFPYPEQFNLLQLLAPVVLVLITRWKAPISTTFLILSLFGGSNLESMMMKSFLGYGIAFLVAIVIWGILAIVNKNEYSINYTSSEKSEKVWSVMQWISTSILWVAWMLQDTANIAVYVPRQLNFTEFLVAMGLISMALFLIIISDGGAIQEIVSEKADIKAAKPATIVDLVYAVILFIFVYVSNVPMSTTWVFLGLLAGREIILHVITQRDDPYMDTFKIVGKDLVFAALGISVSIAIFIIASYVYPSEQSYNFWWLEKLVAVGSTLVE